MFHAYAQVQNWQIIQITNSLDSVYNVMDASYFGSCGLHESD